MGWKNCDEQFRYLPPCGWLALLLKETFRIKSAKIGISVFRIAKR
jgi:hypothetical protein